MSMSIFGFYCVPSHQLLGSKAGCHHQGSESNPSTKRPIVELRSIGPRATVVPCSPQPLAGNLQRYLTTSNLERTQKSKQTHILTLIQPTFD